MSLSYPCKHWRALHVDIVVSSFQAEKACPPIVPLSSPLPFPLTLLATTAAVPIPMKMPKWLRTATNYHEAGSLSCRLRRRSPPRARNLTPSPRAVDFVGPQAAKAFNSHSRHRSATCITCMYWSASAGGHKGSVHAARRLAACFGWHLNRATYDRWASTGI
jgi:hypothetical protein